MRFVLILTVLCTFSLSNAQNKQETRGPENGTLLIVGGAASDFFYEKFMDLIGGPDEPIVVIPTAASSEEFSEEFLDNYRSSYEKRGFTNAIRADDPETFFAFQSASSLVILIFIALLTLQPSLAAGHKAGRVYVLSGVASAKKR